MPSLPSLLPLRRLLAGLVLALPALASGQTTEWSCWYSMDQHISCLLVQAPVAGDLSLEEGQQVRMANAPVAPGSALPMVVAVMRERPYALRGLVMRIPLWTEPVDVAGLGELSQQVMCGSRPECLARYAELPANSLAAAAALADAWDPVLRPLR